MSERERWTVTIERASRLSNLDGQDFPYENQAKAFARQRFAKGDAVRVESSGGSLTVHPSQIMAWLIGSPRDKWPPAN